MESNQPRIQVAVRILRLVPDGTDYVLSLQWGARARASIDLLYLVFGVFTRLAVSAGFRKRLGGPRGSAKLSPGNRFQHERRRLPGLWRPRPRAFPSCNLVTNRSLSALKRPGAVCWPEVQYLHNWRVQLLTPKAGFLNSVRLYALQPPVVA